MNKLQKNVFLVCAAFLAALQLFAQTETGQLTGTVMDPTGAAVSGARLTAQSVATGASRSVTTSTDGAYVLTNLLPGEYTVSVTTPGFAPAERRVAVAVGSRVGQDFRLQVAATSTTVEVSETTTQINT